MDSTRHLAFKDHEGVIRKRVKRFRKSNFLTDVEIIGENGSVFLHKIVLFQKLPGIAQLLCDVCDHHEDTTIIVPEVAREDIEREVRNLYTYGIASGVEELLGIGKNSNMNTVKLEDDATIVSEEKDRDILLFELPDDFVKEATESVNFESYSGDVMNEPKNYIETKTKLKAKKVQRTISEKAVEFQEHTFDLLPGNSSSNPGTLLVDNKYKYFFNKKLPTKVAEQLYYKCSFSGKTKTRCRASALLLRDAVDLVVMIKCAQDQVHNHEASEAKVIAAKMKKEMVDMIKVGLLVAGKC